MKKKMTEQVHKVQSFDREKLSVNKKIRNEFYPREYIFSAHKWKIAMKR